MRNDIKSLLYNKCSQEMQERIATIESKLNLIRESRDNETKSSAGDKYETGRAMMQMEEANAVSQLQEALEVHRILDSIDLGKTINQGQLGSLIYTDFGTFFLSIGIGKVKIDNEIIYCVSPDSPIGRVLVGVEAGTTRIFRGRQYRINQIM